MLDLAISLECLDLILSKWGINHIKIYIVYSGAELPARTVHYNRHPDEPRALAGRGARRRRRRRRRQARAYLATSNLSPQGATPTHRPHSWTSLVEGKKG